MSANELQTKIREYREFKRMAEEDYEYGWHFPNVYYSKPMCPDLGTPFPEMV